MLERPDVEQEDLPYLEGYRRLDSGRSSGGFGPNPIAVSEVLAYLNLVDEDREDERARFLRTVQKLDRTYLTHVAERAASERRGNK